MSGALDGVRIIDLTGVIAGPLGIRTLADYGADVIKVETGPGDPTRVSTPSRHDQMGFLFLQLNRNKRSVVLDLKQPKAMEVMHRLLAQADVIAHNMRPDAIKRLGLDYASCKVHNPKLIHAGIIGFGRGGRNRDRPAFDDLIQAESGLASLFSMNTGAPPRYAPLNLADRLTGVTAAHAILAALYHRERTGEGQAIEIPMFETLVEFLLGDHLTGPMYQPPLGPMGNTRALSLNRRPYPTKDGAISVIPYIDKHWQSFFEVAGLAETAGKDPRFATTTSRARHVEDSFALLADTLATKTTAEWLDLLTKADVPCAPVQTLEGLLTDPHLQDVDLLQSVEHPTEGAIKMTRPPVWMSQTPPSVRSQAHQLGDDTRDVLHELGYTDSETDALLASGVARAAR